MLLSLKHLLNWYYLWQCQSHYCESSMHIRQHLAFRLLSQLKSGDKTLSCKHTSQYEKNTKLIGSMVMVHFPWHIIKFGDLISFCYSIAETKTILLTMLVKTHTLKTQGWVFFSWSLHLVNLLLPGTFQDFCK